MAVLYRITNEVNKKMYFGQTIRKPEVRKNEYFKYGQFPNDHMKNSFNKYGKENFEFDVMFECPDEMLDVCEELLIYLLDTQNPDKGYNKDSGGNLNKRLSEETKQKISEANKGLFAGEDSPRYRDDLDNNEIFDLYVNQGKSLNEIAEILNAPSRTIYDRLVGMEVDIRGNRRDDLDNDEIFDLYVNQGKPLTEIAKILNTPHKTIHNRLIEMEVDIRGNRRDDLDNDEIFDLYVNQGKSQTEIAKILNTNHTTIHDRLVGMGVDTTKSKYNLWDVSCISYNKNKFKNNAGCSPRKAFYIRYNRYILPVGMFIDFVSPKIISDLINEFKEGDKK